MRTVTVRTRQGHEDHFVYTPTEASNEGVEFWHNGRHPDVKEGDWIKTDDGFVVQVLKYGKFDNGKRWIRTCTGSFLLDQDKVFIDTAKRKSRHSFSGTYRNPNSCPLSFGIKEFVRLYVQGKDRISAYKQAFPEASSEKYIDHKTRVLLSRKEVKRLMAEELKDVLGSLGIDDRFILRGMQDIAENGDQDSVRLAAFRDLAKVVGLIDGRKKETTTVQAFLGVSAAELAQLGAPPTDVPVEVVQQPDLPEGEVESAEDSLLG
jgi:hypothetical protein